LRGAAVVAQAGQELQFDYFNPGRVNRVHRPSIAQVVLSFGRGGLETMAVGLASALANRGLRSILIALDEGGDLEPAIRSAGVEYHILGGRRLRDPRFHWRFGQLLRQLRPDVVHSHNFAALLHTAVASRLARVPRMVHTEHAFEYLTDARYHRWIRLASRACDAFIVVGERIVPFFRDRVGIASTRLHVIPNGVDIERFSPQTVDAVQKLALGLPQAGFVVGSAGRLAPEKDLATLVKAIVQVRQFRNDVSLVLVGDGPERPALERLVRASGIGEHVRFLGWRTDVARIVSALDLFVLSSQNEGLPLALLEAMASGVPVVSTPVGEIPRVIEDGVSGRLFPAGDNGVLSGIISALASDDGRRRTLAANGRVVVEERYAHGRMVDRYLGAYGLGDAVKGSGPEPDSMEGVSNTRVAVPQLRDTGTA
jgi:sugar transferase (PEP-CTERM/EpsH1 system associated)